MPPVGQGLVFHNLMKSDFPKHTLQQVQRQSADSGIHEFATAVRHQKENLQLPFFNEDDAEDCSLFPSVNPDEIVELASKFDRANTVVLTATKSTPAGVKKLNLLMQKHVGSDRPCVQIRTEDGDIIDNWTDYGAKLHLGDPIIISKNAYDADVRNGDLGTITSVELRPEDNHYGTIDIDGRELTLSYELLDKIELGYAMTIHKSQGSQWKNVILVLDAEAKRMLDKTLIYTGATRPTDKLIICASEMGVIQTAIACPPNGDSQEIEAPIHIFFKQTQVTKSPDVLDTLSRVSLLM